MRTIKNIAFFSFGFILIALFFELFLHMGGILDPIVTITPKYGERYYPNKTVCSIFVSEGFGLARTNDSGWFGKKFHDKGPNNVSIGVIGSSWVAARQVFYRDNFLSVAERETNKNLRDKTVSLFNFGKEDLPLSEMLYIKDEVASTYHPDKLLVLLNKGCFRDDSHRYVVSYKLMNGEFQLDTSFRQKPFVKNYFKFHAITGSSLLFLLYRVKGRLPTIWQIFFDKYYRFFFIDKTKAETTVPVLFDEDKKIIMELAKDKRVIFLLNFDKELSSQILPLIGNAPRIDLHPAIQKLTKQGIDPYYWEVSNEIGHWNIPAHKVVGTTIANYLVLNISTKE